MRRGRAAAAARRPHQLRLPPGRDSRAPRRGWAGIDIDDFGGSTAGAVRGRPRTRSGRGSAVSPVHGDPQGGTVSRSRLPCRIVDPGAGAARRTRAASRSCRGRWTTSPTMAQVCSALGVDGLITDRPDVLREVLAEHGYKLPRIYPGHHWRNRFTLWGMAADLDRHVRGIVDGVAYLVLATWIPMAGRVRRRSTSPTTATETSTGSRRPMRSTPATSSATRAWPGSSSTPRCCRGTGRALRTSPGWRAQYRLRARETLRGGLSPAGWDGSSVQARAVARRGLAPALRDGRRALGGAPSGRRS